jgi:cell division transport system permease protein
MRLRHFTEAVRSIIRNKMMSLSSVVIVAACLFIVLLMVCFGLNIDAILGNVESGVQVRAFIDDGIDLDRVNSLIVTINNMEHVSQVMYMSKEDNWKEFAENNDIPPDTFQHNPLRANYEITVDNAGNVDSVVEALRQLEGIVNVPHQADTVNTLVSIGNIVRVVFLVIIAVLAILSVVIITNTIRLTIDNRKIEISIMKYIGSTNWFIRWPFLLEGLILGLAGAIIPTVLFIFSYDGFMGYLITEHLSLFANVDFVSGLEVFPVLAPLALALGGVIGTLASISTIRKYLDV